MGTAFESETFWVGFGGEGSLVGTRSEVRSLVEYVREGRIMGRSRGMVEETEVPLIIGNMLVDSFVSPRLWFPSVDGKIGSRIARLTYLSRLRICSDIPASVVLLNPSPRFLLFEQ